MADDLAAWLTQIWDEQEPNIRMAIATGEHGVSQFDLDRIAADRQILALHQPDRVPETWYWRERSCRECRHSWHGETPIGTPQTVIGPERGCPTVRLLALPYADRPGYREDWRPA